MDYKKPSLISSKRNQITFFIIKVKAIYSILVENKATIDFFLEYQLVEHLLSIKINPNIDF